MAARTHPSNYSRPCHRARVSDLEIGDLPEVCRQPLQLVIRQVQASQRHQSGDGLGQIRQHIITDAEALQTREAADAVRQGRQSVRVEAELPQVRQVSDILRQLRETVPLARARATHSRGLVFFARADTARARPPILKIAS